MKPARVREVAITAVTAMLVSGLLTDAVPSAQARAPRCWGRRPTIVGTAGSDTIRGTASADVVVGLGGDDTIIGRGGRDRLCGGDGDDDLVAGGDNDRLQGDAGNDRLAGGPGVADVATYLFATGVHVDLVAGTASGQGHDRLTGVEDIEGSDFDDVIIGDGHTNFLFGWDGNDVLRGGSDWDALWGDAGDDTVAGDDGDDYVFDAAGNDDLDGGAGSFDLVSYFFAATSVDADLAGTAVSSDGTDALTGFEFIEGSDFDDTLTGDTGDNAFLGDLGDDVIDGAAGDDLAAYVFASGPVTVDLGSGSASGADGSDTLSGIEAVEGSPSADTLTGDVSSNGLFGDRGDDHLAGGDGADLLVGGDDVDVADGGNGTDTCEAETTSNCESVTAITSVVTREPLVRPLDRRPMDRREVTMHGRRTSRTHHARLITSLVGVSLVATLSASVPAGASEKPTARFMTYNVYLGANLQPLFQAPDLPELIRRAGAVFAHLDLVDFNIRAVAIAQQIVEQHPDVVSLQEVSMWRSGSDPRNLQTRYDFLQILLDELARQGHPFRAVSISENFSGTLPIDFVGTYGSYTDRNAIIVPSDRPVSELTTSGAMHGVYENGFDVSLAGTPIKVTRGWASIDVTVEGRTYRLFDTHFEAFSDQVRLAQVGELTRIMSSSPYPTVLAGDINLYPMGVRANDDAAWRLLKDQGFRDAWVVAECFQPRFTAGQTDDLDNVPSNLDNTVDYVLFDKDFEPQPAEGSCDIAGEELDDRTDTVPALWPSDHAAAALDMRIAKP